jgi:hypothetical protein
MKYNIMTFEEVAADIGLDFFDRYKKCVEAANDDWLQYKQFNREMDLFIPIDPTTKANHIHNRICGRLKEEFKGNPLVKIDVVNQLIVVKVKDKYIFRTKKFKPKGRVSYTDTNQQRAFMQQGKLDGMFERPLLITGGYMMNKAETDLLGVYFACHSSMVSDGVEWFTNYENYLYQQLSFDLQETQEAEELSTGKSRKIRIKRKPNEDAGQTGTDNK